jgi:hypothetical protein
MTDEVAEKEAIELAQIENTFCMDMHCRCLEFGWNAAKEHFAPEAERLREAERVVEKCRTCGRSGGTHKTSGVWEDDDRPK